MFTLKAHKELKNTFHIFSLENSHLRLRARYKLRFILKPKTKSKFTVDTSQKKDNKQVKTDDYQNKLYKVDFLKSIINVQFQTVDKIMFWDRMSFMDLHS